MFWLAARCDNTHSVVLDANEMLFMVGIPIASSR